MELSRRREALLGRLRQRKTRERERQVLVEGIRSAREALACDADVRFAVRSPTLDSLGEGPELVRDLARAGVDVVRVPEDRMASLADTESPQGLLLVCAEPAPSLASLLEADECRLLVLDGVQDPGNAGTLIRAAAAFGVSGVVALDGTVDPWNPKAVRAAAGTVFRRPVVTEGWQTVGPRLREARVPLLVADPGGADVAGMEAGRRWGLVVGNEARGPRAEVMEAGRTSVGIPMVGGADSLNVAMAGAVLLYVLTRPHAGPRAAGGRLEEDLETTSPGNGGGP